MNDELTPSNYWLDIAVREIIATYPNGKIIISSGISPSASYHIGHFREILTADALTWGVRRSGREVEHIHIVDNFDPLRRRYDFLPESYDKYVGWPICLVPDPIDDCRDKHITYAEHFYQEFEKYAKKMGINPDKVIRSYEDLYLTGKMARNIELSIKKVNLIKDIFREVANRDLQDDWLPLQLLSANNSFTELSFDSIDLNKKLIIGTDASGSKQILDYSKGQVKLNWRLDWPARWEVLGVMVEPFSVQEHGAAGSSYDTGTLFSEKIFDYNPPIPGVRYANIHMLGDTKKMSSSKGNIITPEDALDVMPPEVIRYFIVRSKPDRTLYWDSSQGLFNLIREFAMTKDIVEAGGVAEFADAYSYAIASGMTNTISGVPFDHLVQVYQAARGDSNTALEMIARTGFEKDVKNSKNEILEEFKFVKNWLKNYAPDEIKFSLQEVIPDREFSVNIKLFFNQLADLIEKENLNGEGMHEAIYKSLKTAEIKPGEAFKGLYQILIDKESGPKAGWFLASLDSKWLVSRLRLEQ